MEQVRVNYQKLEKLWNLQNEDINFYNTILNSVLSYRNSKGVKYLMRLCLGFSHP